MDPLIISAGIGLASLAMTWIMLRQKVGTDVTTGLRSDLARTQAELSRVAADNEVCKREQEAMRTRYETTLGELRSENLQLMRQALRLDRDP